MVSFGNVGGIFAASTLLGYWLSTVLHLEREFHLYRRDLRCNGLHDCLCRRHRDCLRTKLDKVWNTNCAWVITSRNRPKRNIVRVRAVFGVLEQRYPIIRPMG
jgi:hypothetical protein